MALLFIDGFDTYDTAGLTIRWTSVNGFSIQPTAGRRGGPCLQCGGGSSLTKPLPTQPSTVVVGFAIMFFGTPAVGKFIRFFDASTPQVELRVNGSRCIDIYSNNTLLASGAIVLSMNSFYFVEFKFTVAASIAANSCAVRINGVTDAVAAAGLSTKQGTHTYVDSFEFGNTNVALPISVDDLYMLDGTGSRLNDFLGDKKVEARFPNGDGSLLAWTAVGDTNDYKCVDEHPHDGDTTYVSSNTPGDYDTYLFPNLGAGASAVDAVQVSITARKDDAGSRAIAPALVISGTTYDGTTVTLPDSYTYMPQVWERNPATSANWTEAEVNALEAGVKLVS